MIDAVLRPGDALYLPRGYIHSAAALGEISAHLTIGVHSVTRWARRRVGAGPGAHARRRGPAAARLASRSASTWPTRTALRDDVAAVIAGLQDWLGRVDPAEVADRLRARTWAQVRPEPVAPLAQSAAAAALTDDAVLRLRRRLRCALRDGAGRRGSPCSPGGARTPSPADVRDALAALLAAGELKVGDLPGLDAADRLDAGPAAGDRVGRHRARRARVATDSGSVSRPDPVAAGAPARPAGRLDPTAARCGRWPAATPPSPPRPRPSAGC